MAVERSDCWLLLAANRFVWWSKQRTGFGRAAATTGAFDEMTGLRGPARINTRLLILGIVVLLGCGAVIVGRAVARSIKAQELMAMQRAIRQENDAISKANEDRLAAEKARRDQQLAADAAAREAAIKRFMEVLVRETKEAEHGRPDESEREENKPRNLGVTKQAYHALRNGMMPIEVDLVVGKWGEEQSSSGNQAVYVWRDDFRIITVYFVNDKLTAKSQSGL